MKLLLLFTIIIYWYSATKAAEVETSANPSYLINPERSRNSIERRDEPKPINSYFRYGRSDGKSFKNFIRINRGDTPGSNEDKATGDFFIRLGKRSYVGVPDDDEDGASNDVLDYWGRYGPGPGEEVEYRELEPKYIRFGRSHPTIRFG